MRQSVKSNKEKDLHKRKEIYIKEKRCVIRTELVESLPEHLSFFADLISDSLHCFPIFFYNFPTICGSYRLDLTRNRWKCHGLENR